MEFALIPDDYGRRGARYGFQSTMSGTAHMIRLGSGPVLQLLLRYTQAIWWSKKEYDRLLPAA